MVHLALYTHESAGQSQESNATTSKTTYALILETLYNRKGSWIVDILHNKPIDGFFVLAIDSGSLDQFGLDPVNGVGLVVCVEMDCESIDHCDWI